MNEPSYEEQRQEAKEEEDYQEDDYEEEEKEAPKEMKARVALSQIEESFEEIKFKLQAKGTKPQDIASFFFNPFKPQQQASISEFKQILDRAGVEDAKNLLIARYIVETDLPGDRTVEFSESNSAS